MVSKQYSNDSRSGCKSRIPIIPIGVTTYDPNNKRCDGRMCRAHTPRKNVHSNRKNLSPSRNPLPPSLPPSITHSVCPSATHPHPPAHTPLRRRPTGARARRIYLRAPTPVRPVRGPSPAPRADGVSLFSTARLVVAVGGRCRTRVIDTLRKRVSAPKFNGPNRSVCGGTGDSAGPCKPRGPARYPSLRHPPKCHRKSTSGA